MTISLALTGSHFSLRIHAGGGTYVDSNGYTWSADNGYSDGTVIQTTYPIANTIASPLYQTGRAGYSQYQLTVPNGNYTVNLKFAEIQYTTAGSRLMYVTINGSVALSGFDITAAAGAPFTAIDRAFPVSVTDGQLNITFVGVPLINAIEVVEQGAALSLTAAAPPAGFTALRINSGGAALTDSLGYGWSGDIAYSGGTAVATGSAIANTTDMPIYQTARSGVSLYEVPVPNGNYMVKLRFAELSKTAAGQRIFNVSLNGRNVLPNFDIISAALAWATAVDRSFPITVTNGVIVIALSAGSADVPLINGIEVVGAN